MNHPIVHEPPTLGGARAIVGALLKLAGLAILLVALLAFPSFAQQSTARTSELNTFGVDATIRFDTGSSKIRLDAMTLLEQTLDVLRNAPLLRIRIEGHADVPGATAYNITLAWDRAGATKVWLSNRGIDPDRIEAVGFSRSWTHCEATDHACWSRVRRYEFLIVAGTDSVLPGTP
jgi:peptidoglycan-associated lipoprotein